MNAGHLAGAIGLATLLLAVALFLVGLRRSLEAAWLAWQGASKERPLRLHVTDRNDFGAYFQVRLQRAPGWRWWPLPRFEAGMYLTLLGPAEAGRPGQVARRRYSLAAWTHRTLAYELAIKREPGGLVSNWAAEQLVLGASAEFVRPAGDFCPPREVPGEMVLIGAGIGITPLRAMAHAWLEAQSTMPLTLIWSVRQMAEFMDYHDEFVALAQRMRAFRYVPVLTGDDGSWQGEHGRVDAERVLRWCQTDAPCGYWMCASTPMMDALRQGLRARAVPAVQIHQEAFGAAANADGHRYSIQVQPSGRVLNFCGQPSLLALLQQEGEPVISDCRNGTCGSCRVRLENGHTREVIAPEWRVARNEVLTCCAVPASDLVVSLTGP